MLIRMQIFRVQPDGDDIGKKLLHELSYRCIRIVIAQHGNRFVFTVICFHDVRKALYGALLNNHIIYNNFMCSSAGTRLTEFLYINIHSLSLRLCIFHCLCFQILLYVFLFHAVSGIADHICDDGDTDP